MSSRIVRWGCILAIGFLLFAMAANRLKPEFSIKHKSLLFAS
jgi:hypothetical protein